MVYLLFSTINQGFSKSSLLYCKGTSFLSASINFHSRSTRNGMPGSSIPLHRRSKTGINIRFTFGNQTYFNRTAAGNQLDMFVFLLHRINVRFGLRSRCEREATTTNRSRCRSCGNRTEAATSLSSVASSSKVVMPDSL